LVALLAKKRLSWSFQDNLPVYYPSPNVSRPASQLTEEEQVKIAQRMGLIQHLPTGSYDGCKKNRE
jgi:E3 ubiquitin-protein ligase RNF11